MRVRDFRMVAALGVALIAGSVHAGEAPATGVSQTSRPSPTAAPPLTAATPPQAPATKLREPDVIYVPTPQNVVDAMLKMANVTAKDVVYDLGSGDGRIPITAAEKYGARGVGIDINPERIKEANANLAKSKAGDKVRFLNQDLFETDLSPATVITLYLLPALNMKLRPQLLSMRPGTRIVSHSFSMEDWEADEISTLDGRRAYFWIVPANVMGSWSLDAGGQRHDMTLEQTFQKASGTLALGPIHAGLRDVKLRGTAISFSYVDQNKVRRDFTGRVNGGKMEGSFRDEKGAEGKWTATKK